MDNNTMAELGYRINPEIFTETMKNSIDAPFTHTMTT